MNSKVVAAVDLGYGHAKYSRVRGPEVVFDSFPSFATTGGAASSMANGAGLRELDVVSVNVDGRDYLVGKDAHLIRGASVERNRDANYSASDQYMAMMLGCMWYMQQSVIDVLVVGLPMNTLEKSKEALKARLKGTHVVPEWRTECRDVKIDKTSVEVKEVLAYGQPVGALLDVCAAHPEFQRDNLVVVDVGYNTLDLFGMEDGKPRPDRIAAWPGGVASYIDEVTRSLNAQVRREHPEMREDLRISSHAYEAAIRTGRPLRTSLGDLDLAPHIRTAAPRLEGQLDLLAAKLDAYGDITRAVIAGGGAPLLHEPFKKRFPLLKQVFVPENPQFSVVRGFWQAGRAKAGIGG